MEKLLIFPYNGNGIETMCCIDGQYEMIGFIDDTKEKQGTLPNGLQVYTREIIKKYKEAKVLLVPGSPASFKNRETLINAFKLPKERYAKVIHPKASVASIAQIGYNTLIMAGVVLTSNCVVGNHVVILPNSVIHHDTVIGDYTLIGSNVAIAGNVIVEENCYVATGSNIINGAIIGKQSIIGIGTNVIKNIPANSKVVGNPAKQI